MESNFSKRVESERLFLDLINESAALPTTLVGLADLTVENWLANNADDLPSELLYRLQNLLHEAARITRSEADISDEIFLEIDSKSQEKILNELSCCLADIQNYRRG